MARTLLVRDGKESKDRFLPVPGRTAAALGVYHTDVRPELVVDPHEGALLLAAWWGHGLSEMTITYLLRRRGARRPGILGHKKLVTTGLYTRVVIDGLRQAVARARPRDKARRVRRSGKMRVKVKR